MNKANKNLLKLVGTIAILTVWVVFVSPYIDVWDNKLVGGLMLADIACIIAFRAFVEFRL